MAKSIYVRNLLEIERVFDSPEDNVLLACIDDFDPGTIWEVGYGAGYRRGLQCRGIWPTGKIIAFSTQGHGLNIMLAESCDGFLPDPSSLAQYLAATNTGQRDAVAQLWKGDVV